MQIKMMKQGMPWIGRMDFDEIPQPGDTVTLGSGETFRVLRSIIDDEDEGIPFLALDPTPVLVTARHHDPRRIT